MRVQRIIATTIFAGLAATPLWLTPLDRALASPNFGSGWQNDVDGPSARIPQSESLLHTAGTAIEYGLMTASVGDEATEHENASRWGTAHYGVDIATGGVLGQIRTAVGQTNEARSERGIRLGGISLNALDYAPTDEERCEQRALIEEREQLAGISARGADYAPAEKRSCGGERHAGISFNALD